MARRSFDRAAAAHTDDFRREGVGLVLRARGGEVEEELGIYWAIDDCRRLHQ